MAVNGHTTTIPGESQMTGREPVVIIPREGQPAIIGVLEHMDIEDDWVRLSAPLMYTMKNPGGDGAGDIVAFQRPPWGVPPSALINSPDLVLHASEEMERAYTTAARSLIDRPVRVQFTIQ